MVYMNLLGDAAAWVGDRLWDIVRSLLFFIDNIVYNLIPVIYKLFIYLSKLNLMDASGELSNLVNQFHQLLQHE